MFLDLGDKGKYREAMYDITQSLDRPTIGMPIIDKRCCERQYRASSAVRHMHASLTDI